MKETIEAIIQLTFQRLKEVFDNQKEGVNKNLTFVEGQSRLVFPCYGQHRNSETRISEQELRFAFVETFNSYCDKHNLNLFYAVEVPTKGIYCNFADKKNEPRIAKSNEQGRSAEFDLVIYDENLNRKCLIEFKAKNADKHAHSKDLVKLNNKEEGDTDVLRYLIEIVKTAEKKSYKKIHAKIKGSEQIFKCFSLNDNEDITEKICEAHVE